MSYTPKMTACPLPILMHRAETPLPSTARPSLLSRSRRTVKEEVAETEEELEVAALAWMRVLTRSTGFVRIVETTPVSAPANAGTAAFGIGV